MRVTDTGMTNFEAQMPKGKHRGTRSSFKHSTLFRHSSFVICYSALAISFALTLSLRGQSAPSAKDILASVRMMESRQQIDLQGQLRQDNTVVPFRLVQNGPLIRYSFANPDEVLQLRLGENSSRLDLVTEDGTEQFAASKLKQKIRGTSVTYEDLAFKFLYWPTRARPGRGKCSHAQLLEAATARALARIAVFQRATVDRQGERRADAHGGLRLERSIGQAFRSGFRAEDRRPLVLKTDAHRRIAAWD